MCRDRLALRFLQDGEQAEERLTDGELDHRARILAAHLQQRNGTGDRVLLLFPPGLEYVVAFFGCLYAGQVAVPAYPPRNRRGFPRLAAILDDAAPRAVLTTGALAAAARELLAELPASTRPDLLTLGELDPAAAEDWREPGTGAEALAFLQYTSGSTSTPKGVEVRHRDLLANQELIRQAFGTTPESVVVSWLPLYHDMGLIGGLLHPLWLGSECILLSPFHFLQRPARWLEAVSRFRATVSGGPNFAYDLCVDRVSPEQRRPLDLSCWKLAFNGAEPVRAETLDRFAGAFAGRGFDRRAFFPCYGLAEATLLVTGGPGPERGPGTEPRVHAVDAAALERHRVVPLPAAGGAAVRRLVSSGAPPAGVRVRVVDPETRREVGPGRVGEIWIAGPSVAAGYRNRPEASREAFAARLAGSGDGPFLRSGDLGFVADGELFVTGRLKDLIVIRGRNLYPQDVEWTAAASHPSLRAGGTAAFSVEVAGEERLGLAQELGFRQDPDLREVAEAIRRAVAEEHEVAVEVLALLRPGQVPKTTSGKVRRRACRDLLLAGELEVVGQWRGAPQSAAVSRRAPRTPVEEAVARGWAEVLEREPESVGVDEDFFEAGGDSLRAGRLVARLEEAFGVSLPPNLLFEAPTVEELAGRMEEAGRGRPAPAWTAGAAPNESSADAPLTFAQQRLWFLDRLAPGDPVYNLGVVVELAGRLDGGRLRRALEEVVNRHDALRTVLAWGEDGPVQRVAPPRPTRLPLVDLSALPATARAGRAGGAARQATARSFDLERGPLARFLLVRRSRDVHELTLALHHVISDAWSMAILVREVLTNYARHGEGRPAALPPLALRLSDLARLERRRWTPEALESGLAYWRRRLAPPLPTLELPADRPRPAVRSSRGAHRRQTLDGETVALLTRWGRSRRATLFMVLLAGFDALLHRYSGQRDLIVGTAVAHRGRVEVEGLVGFLIDTLALRATVTGELPASALLDRVREVTLEAQARQQVPFERVVDDLPLERDRSRTPVVQAMLVLQNAPSTVRPAGGLAVTSAREVDHGVARFDLAVSAQPAGEGLEVTWKYSRDLFDAATIDRMAAHFGRLLHAAAVAPERPVAELAWLSPAEIHHLAREHNDTARAWPEPEAGLEDLLRRQARQRPDVVAVVFEGEALTYGELAGRARGVAAVLGAHGVGADQVVGILAERSLELIVGLAGILEAGGAYLPLDPSYPRERLEFMLADAGARCVLVQRGLESVLDPDVRRVALDAAVRSAAAEAPPAAPGNADRLAYVIYTSGSTGRPKGVMVSHRAIVNRLLWMQEAYRLAPGEPVLHKTPTGFDVSLWELFWPPLAGARQVLARPGGHQDASYLVRRIAEERVTTLHFVPSMLQVFLDAPEIADARCLTRVVASGEALPPSLAERLRERLPATGLHNLYGPTEAAVDVTAWACLPEPDLSTVPLGRPIANVRVHVVDGRFAPAPPGVPGELVLAGVGLARGYRGRAALTAERFVPDALSSVPGERLYRTGDLTRRLSDGRLEFLGRLDHQVKIRGVRVEPGEVEAVLARHAAVREAVVIVRDDLPGGSRHVVAYVVPRQLGAPADVGELRRFAAERLPEAMVPSFVVALDDLPRVPSGKVDRKALPRPDAADRRAERAAEPPATPLESRLAELWQEMLGVERVGRHDDFFELGGDSIQGALLVNRLQRELQAVIYVMALFDAPTVARLAEYLERHYPGSFVAAGRARTAAPRVEIRDEDVEALERHLEGRFSPPSPGLPPGAAKNPPAVFLLSPFRSGSTLLRVMLAGHPRLFAPPELELLGFESLGERRRCFTGRDRFAREGLVRALMELRGLDAAGAEALLHELERQDDSVPALYRRLQGWLGGRLLVDKTPRYALHRPTLERAEAWFEAPRYVHLVRHPAATVHSYLEARMDRVYRFPGPPRRQAELVWWQGHRNVVGFLAGVPRERWCRVAFEDLVARPREVLAELCGRLGLEPVPEMLQPYQGGRMTDGIREGGRMMGDPRFHEHRRIDPRVAERWRGEVDPATLDPRVRRLARELGYEAETPAGEAPRAAGSVEVPRVPREGDLALSFAQRRLWFLDRLQPGSALYNMPAAVGLAGRLGAAVLQQAFGEVRRRHEVLRAVFPAGDGQPRQQIRGGGRLPLPRVDLRRLGVADKRRERDLLGRRHGSRPFDLAAGPLLRAGLVAEGVDRHVLLIALHHVVSDGWSIGVLVREAASLYGAFRQGRPSPLPELPVQYVDYAAWQRGRLTGDTLREMVDGWRRRLEGAPPVLQLPTDRPRPAVRSQAGARRVVSLPAAELAPLRRLARDRGVPLFVALAATWLVLLHRWSGQRDLTLGIPEAGRRLLEAEPLIGFFVNTLVLRLQADGREPGSAWLDRLRAVHAEALAGAELPFEKLVEELGVERSLSWTPLFQVMLAFQNAPFEELALPGLELSPLDLDPGIAKFDLLLSLAERDGRLEGFLEYDTALFDATTIQRVEAHWRRLLAGLAEAPERPVASLPRLSVAERHQASREWNDTAWTGAGEITLPDLIHRSCRRTPDSTALVFEGRHLTYGELGRRIDGLAGRLRQRGLGPEMLVGVVMERSLELPGVLAAVLQAGGAYVPLDPGLPPSRIAWMLEDALSGAGATRPVLAERRFADRLRGTGLDVVPVEEAWTAGPAPPRPAVDSPDRLAYTIYTSGSTGRPKGVMNSHRGIVNRLAWMAGLLGLDRDERVLQKTPTSFDVSVWELFWPLVAGATLVLARPAGHRDGAYLVRCLREEAITLAHFVPSMLQVFLEGDVQGCHALRRVVASGEALTTELARRFARRLPAELFNLYGPTEAAVEVTWWPCRWGIGRDGVPIGRPVPGVTAQVAEPSGTPTPVGVVGELYLGGVQVARGYWRRPALTAERFVPDSWSDAPGARCYRTGDRVVRRPGGEVVFLGRLDHQVKVRGVRLELGEVEATLAEHPAVREAVVILRDDGPGGEWLVAYAVQDDPGSVEPVDGRALQAFLRERLPGPAVPGAVVLLDELPLNPSGKVDRRALPAPEIGRDSAQVRFVAPEGELERRLAALWASILGLERVGVEDNFFDLGGHSLLAAELHGRLERELGAGLELLDLFRHPTVRSLAGRLSAGPRGGGGDEDLETMQEQLAETREALRHRRRRARARRETSLV